VPFVEIWTVSVILTFSNNVARTFTLFCPLGDGMKYGFLAVDKEISVRSLVP
jgi:hypothetical protein